MKLTRLSSIGWEVDKTTKGNVCTVALGDECQAASVSSGPGGFYPTSVAVDPKTDNVYVADIVNHRIQEFTKTGVFVSMFGWNVNKTKDEEAGSRQSERNICTALSDDLCTVGVPGIRPGQLNAPFSVAVDPLSADVYVLDVAPGDVRVDKYTRDGRFAWRVGKGVNPRKRNLCRASEVGRDQVLCKRGIENHDDSLEHGALKSSSQSGDLLAVGGPEHVLYVGDEHRVQVFDTDGGWRREIMLASLSAEPHSSVVAFALDTTGALYVTYRAGSIETDLPAEHADIIHVFDPNGEQVAEYSIGARHPGAIVSINGMAIDRFGRLAAIGTEIGMDASGRFGWIYDTYSEHMISGFSTPTDNEGIAFNGSDDLYIATAANHEVAVYSSAGMYNYYSLMEWV